MSLMGYYLSNIHQKNPSIQPCLVSLPNHRKFFIFWLRGTKWSKESRMVIIKKRDHHHHRYHKAAAGYQPPIS